MVSGLAKNETSRASLRLALFAYAPLPLADGRIKILSYTSSPMPRRAKGIFKTSERDEDVADESPEICINAW
jgi:hypothetical protein